MRRACGSFFQEIFCLLVFLHSIHYISRMICYANNDKLHLRIANKHEIRLESTLLLVLQGNVCLQSVYYFWWCTEHHTFFDE